MRRFPEHETLFGQQFLVSFDVETRSVGNPLAQAFQRRLDREEIGIVKTETGLSGAAAGLKPREI